MTHRPGPSGIGTGILVGAACAGPIFLVMMAFGALAATSQPVPVRTEAALLLLLLIPATLAGFILALIPLAIGALAMGWLGAGNEAMRLPVAWALAGGGAAGLVASLWSDSDEGLRVALTGTGILCALICRRFVGWECLAPPPSFRYRAADDI